MPEFEQISDLATAEEVLLSTIRFFDGADAWWRGHANRDWQLLPRVYRNEEGHRRESDLLLRFMLQARTRMPDPPKGAKTKDWIFIAQHYGLPTRVLDWSESLLVALYFAVADANNDETDGALWCLEPGRLNQMQTGDRRVFAPFHPGVKSALETPRIDENMPSDAAATIGDQHAKTLAVAPEQTDIRHFVQSAMSTIHGLTESLDELPDSEQFLRKFIIPADAKRSLRARLRILGFSESTMFPTLDALAKTLAVRLMPTMK